MAFWLVIVKVKYQTRSYNLKKIQSNKMIIKIFLVSRLYLDPNSQNFKQILFPKRMIHSNQTLTTFLRTCYHHWAMNKFVNKNNAPPHFYLLNNEKLKLR